MDSGREEKIMLSEIDSLVEEYMNSKTDGDRHALRDRLLFLILRATKLMLMSFERTEKRVGAIEYELTGNGCWGFRKTVKWVMLRSRVEMFVLSCVGLWLAWRVIPAALKAITGWIALL